MTLVVDIGSFAEPGKILLSLLYGMFDRLQVSRFCTHVQNRFNTTMDNDLIRVKLGMVLDHGPGDESVKEPTVIKDGPKWAPWNWTSYIHTCRRPFLVLKILKVLPF